MNIKNKYYLFLICIFAVNHSKSVDVTIIGNLGRLGKPSGTGLHATTFLQLLKHHATIYYKPTNNIPNQNHLNVSLESVNIINDLSKAPSPHVVIYTQYENNFFLADNAINLAYIAWESTKLPPQFSKTLNKFDAVIVTDNFLVKVLKDSKIDKPVFVLPPALNLTHFLEQPLKDNPHNPFTFGCVSSFCTRKNLLFLIKAFYSAFAHSHNVRLIIHSNQVFQKNFSTIVEYLKQKHINNVIIDHTNYNAKQLLDLYKTIDCYVLLSKGEGFSITPREAMSLGIPCILANNTGHRTICDTGLVVGVTSDRPERVNSQQIGPYGYWFNTDMDETIAAMHDISHNYKRHLQLAAKRREWVKQYLPENLRAKYISLIAPQQVILCNINEIGVDYIKTSSHELYNKYQTLLKNQ